VPFRRDSPRPCAIERTEVAGIPCFWGEAPPPFTATLVFRVGRADETLATSGITHICEHLLMPAAPPRDLDRNARVEDSFAVFWATGNERRVLRFLEDTAALIASPPVERIATERKILQAEAASRGVHSVNAAMALRFGARAHGLAGYDEYGLNSVGPDEAREWIGRYFTRPNAGLWMTGRPPRDFRPELPDGSRVAPVKPEPLADVSFPSAFVGGPDDTVVASFLSPRSPAFSAAYTVLVDRAWKRIRYEQGLAYDVGDWYEQLTGKVSASTLWIESLEENTQPVRNALLGILEDLAESGASEEELAENLGTYRETVSDPTELPSSLHFSAVEHLFGEPFVDAAEWLRRRREVTSEATAAAIRPALESLLLILPEDSDVPQGFTEYPRFSPAAVQGVVHRPRARLGPERKLRLVLGEEGISILLADGDKLTVRWSELAACVHWPDGTRTLWGLDGYSVYVDGTAFRKKERIVERIDERVPPELVVVMEPELTEKAQRVERAASEKLGRRWVVADELDLLADELEDGEEILTLAEGSQGLRAGLLVLTDRRLLWLYKMFAEKRIELALADVESVEARRKFMETTVEVVARGETHKFEEIAPKDRAAELEALLRERIRTSADPG
jgi:hypothetical protein